MVDKNIRKLKSYDPAMNEFGIGDEREIEEAVKELNEARWLLLDTKLSFSLYSGLRNKLVQNEQA